MDYSSDFSLETNGSRLLSESPMLPSSSSLSSSSSQADLSLSELSISERRPESPSSSSSSRPFSLLARPVSPSTPVQTRRSNPKEVGDENSNEHEDMEDDEDFGEITQKQITVDDEQAATSDSEEREQVIRTKAKLLREDKLQNDIFVLRKLNAAFSSFNEALEGVGDANERISEQLSQTEALLNRYMMILAKSEEISRLIFDEDWEGAEQDEMILRREEEERIEKERREAEERALAEQRERERLEREAKELQERIERERKDHTASSRGGSGVRGVRGTRASTRGMRGAVSSTRGSSTNNTTRGHSSGPSRVPPPGRFVRGTVRRG
ncbi:uncharacterized protein C8R40DRAFT_306319 [Lentinula edodes]|uniref:uncharacterized protein n=1 Tax=Lentinula edodes TaxID=5353 RepID=UPI001E8E43A0|nr:uncharacterized protein C8R40DRAFT_306319 [Lentinula edodes]KAH7874785.1 hypothetical protein C8R40DRAFT_306319 [Lentinula edodes]